MKIRQIRPRQGLALRLWHWLWTPVVITLALGPLALVNLAQMLSLLLLPFSPAAYRAYNRWIAFSIWGYWAWAMDHVIGTRFAWSGDPLPMRENAIVIANHQSMSDIIVILCLAWRHGRVGDCKWMVKDVLKYVPGAGWGMLFLDCLFLKRTWADDAEQIRQTFARYINGRVPLWLVSFPEGTRLTPAKLQASQAYAAKSGATATKHVLLPRPRGFAASVQGLRRHVTAVYSITIIHDGRAPSLTEMVRGDTDRVRVDIRRTPISELPEGEQALSQWLTADFLRKDALMTQASSNSQVDR